MTSAEYQKQKERVEKYQMLSEKMSDLKEMKGLVKDGILSIRCEFGDDVNLCRFGDEFSFKVASAIISFLDVEIENIRKEMEKM